MQSKDKTISFENNGTEYPFGLPSTRGDGYTPQVHLFPGANRP
jgi:hypothetical protein